MLLKECLFYYGPTSNFILDPETQAANARHILISPGVEGAPVDQSLYDQHLLPSPDDFNKLLDLNWDVVTKKRPEWTERWRREITIK